MDLIKNGKLLSDLRKSKGLTQKQVAEVLGVVPKTVSKWETGKGFPDVSTVPALADILGVTERALLSGCLPQNAKDVGNLRKTKFYICPYCGSILYGVGECQIICCGKPLAPSEPKEADVEHSIKISEVENDFYIEFTHPMTKEHFINFVTYVGVDRVLTVRLYPEQASTVRFSRMYWGKLYYYCNKHGLFEIKLSRKLNI